MRRYLCWLSLVLSVVGLVGCRAGGTAPAQSPEDVHAAWVNALRNNDRQAALAVMGVHGELGDAFAGQMLNQTQSMIANQRNRVRELGPLEGVDILPVVDRGAGKIGYSCWRFQQVTLCYGTMLAADGDQWGVTDWGTVKDCPNQ